jgi:hypothetical protein
MLISKNPWANEDSDYKDNPWADLSEAWTDEMIEKVGGMDFENDGIFFLSAKDYHSNFIFTCWAEIY